MKELMRFIFLVMIIIVLVTVIVNLAMKKYEEESKSACLNAPSNIERGVVSPHNLDKELLC